MTSYKDWLAKGYDTLIPIAPPTAEVKDAGKRPAAYDARTGKWYGLTNWNGRRVDEADPEVWQSWGANLGLVNDGSYFIVDIDSYDEHVGDQIERLARKMLGDAPRRVGQWPKRALLYRAEDRIGSFNMPYGDGRDRVETTSAGKQIVIAGTHPSGSPYTWDKDVPPKDALTAVSGEQARAFFERLEKGLPKATLRAGSAEQAAPKDPEDLKGDHDLIRQAVKSIPNGRETDWDEYIALGQAIRGAFGPGYEEEAFEVWDEWAQSWPDGYEAELVRKHWDTMLPSRSLGAEYVLSKAGDQFLAQHYFTPHVSDLVSDMFSAADTQERADSGVYEILRIGDIFALPDPTFAIDRHIPEASMGFLYGRPGCGKSFIALDWALHIAYGLPTWHGDPIKVRPGANVLYLAREGSTGFKARIRAWQEKHLVPVDREPTFALIRQTINFMQAEDIGKIVRTARQALHGPVDLIVVDTVSRVLPGADENLQKEMTLFVKACDALQDAFKAIVLGVHHSGKSGDMRGSSVLKGAGDFVFKLERKEGARTGQLICEKQKDAPDGWSEHYAFPTVEFGNGAGQSLVPERVQGKEVASDACDQSRREDILAAIQAAWDAGNPWSPAPQAKERYAVKRMSLDFDVKAEVAEQWLAIWLDEGRIVVDVADRHSKSKGYRVADAAAVAQESVFD